MHKFLLICEKYNMNTIHINNAVWKEGDYFVAQCLNVEVSSFGESRDKALANLQEALELYFEDNEHPEITVIEHPEIVDSIIQYA